jgi:tRNA (cytidine/uridine-2'-O-)-methyltransferase
MSELAIALWEPEIPPNTGNIARLCAATETPLHLIGRLGFHIDERAVRRAGLDYWQWLTLLRHNSFEAFESHLAGTTASGRIVCFSAHADRSYTQITFRPGDCLLFGSESRGLPESILTQYAETTVTIPMTSAKVRSLNLATSAGIALYEALRQLHQW